MISSLNDVAVVKGIAAFGAESGRCTPLLRLPAALIALVLGNTCRLLCAAFGTEFSLVDCTAFAGPAIVGRFGTSALRAELTGSGSTTLACPAALGLGFGFLSAALGAEFTGSGGTAGAGPISKCFSDIA